MRSRPLFWAKTDAKVRTFEITTKFFGRKVSGKEQKTEVLDLNQPENSLYHII
jgi:hypothetical protein